MIRVERTAARSSRGRSVLGWSSVLFLVSGGVAAGSFGCSEPPPEDGGGGASPAPSSGGGSGAGEASGGSTSGGGGPGDPTLKLLWSDEFEGSGLPDAAIWSFESMGPGWVNRELQNYTGAREENVRLENGSLIIEARRDFYEGHEYSSARIHTAGQAEFTYGRFEARAKLPRGLGTWPAIWMMPGDVFKYATTCDAETGWISGCNAWPNSGEIDIMEHVGYDPGVVHSTIHCAAYNWQLPLQKTAEIEVGDVFDTFHVYAVERRPDRIDAFVDGQRYFTYEKESDDWRFWPFDEPFYFILNIAVGGDWGGAQGVDPDAFPTRMEVDYVRVYELDDL